MEDDRLGLDLAVLDVHLVAAEHDGDVLTDADQIAVPVGHVLVGGPGRDVEHQDRTLALQKDIRRRQAHQQRPSHTSAETVTHVS